MPDLPASSGPLILVVGPSGAGKDTLIDHARRIFAGRPVVFARRIVTRAPTSAESHDTLDREAFARAQLNGEFAISWQAHGLDYAIPRTVEANLARGNCVVCNVSRAVVAEVRARYRRVSVIYVDAPFAVRQARIAGRRRPGEDPGRAGRVQEFVPDAADHLVQNGGELADACRSFEAAIEAALTTS